MPNEVETFTWLGAVLLALCGVPQAWRAHVEPESTRGLSWLFLMAWGLGELAMLAGLAGVVSWHVLANYVGNVVLVSYVSGVKFANRSEPYRG